MNRSASAMRRWLAIGAWLPLLGGLGAFGSSAVAGPVVAPERPRCVPAAEPPPKGKADAAERRERRRGSTQRPAARSRFYKTEHTVARGETLARIASKYRVSVSDILTWNNLESSELLRVGQKLRIYTASRSAIARRVPYVVEKGDRFVTIAKKFGMTTGRLKSLNPRLRDVRLIRPGMTLQVEIYGPEEPSEAAGRPQAGRLAQGEQLPKGPGYFIRRPENAWGTNETITALVGVFHEMHRKHPGYVAAIGDISREGGGRLPPHHSHQNGRDVDISYYIEGVKKASRFPTAAPSTLDAKRTWALIDLFLKNSQVEMILIDYSLQKPLYAEAKRVGLSDKRLAEVFQYPAGRHVSQGIIRHSAGHKNHLHIRFSCPRSDASCN